MTDKKRVVRMLALNINERDLSIGLVMLKEYALEDPVIAEHYDIYLHQWMKDYASRGAPGTVDGLNIDDVVDSLRPEETDVFGFSTYIWSHDFMTAVARALKARNPNAVMLFGGSQAGGYGARWLEDYACADYVIKGEAEYAFRGFLRGLLDDDLSEVGNLFFRQNGEVRTNLPSDKRAAKKMTYLPTIEDLPMPFRSQEYRDWWDDFWDWRRERDAFDRAA